MVLLVEEGEVMRRMCHGGSRGASDRLDFGIRGVEEFDVRWVRWVRTVEVGCPGMLRLLDRDLGLAEIQGARVEAGAMVPKISQLFQSESNNCKEDKIHIRDMS